VKIHQCRWRSIVDLPVQVVGHFTGAAFGNHRAQDSSDNHYDILRNTHFGATSILA